MAETKKIKVHLSELDPSIQEEINAMPMADRIKTFERLGIDDSPQGGFFSRMLQGAPSEGMSYPDDDKAKMEAIGEHFKLGGKMAAGAAPNIGRGGPFAMMAGAAMNGMYGPDPTSSRGIGDLVTQTAAAKFMPFLPGKGWNNLTNVGIGAAQGVGANIATSIAEAARGEQGDVNPLRNPVSLGWQAILPAAANRLGNSLPSALERTPQAFRDKVTSIMGKLQPPQINVAEGQLPQVPQPQVTQAPVPEITPKLANQMAKASKMNALLRNAGIDAETAANMTDEHWANLEKAAQVSTSSPETRALTMKMLGGTAETPVPAVAAPVTPPIEAPAVPTIDELYKTATASTPLLKSGIKAADRQAIEGLMARQMPDGTAIPRQPSEYISDLVDSSDWSSLPKVIDKMDQVYKNGEFKKAVQTKITENVLNAVGPDGALGDLSPLKRIKTFHDMPVGDGRRGRDVLKDVFGGSPEAGANLESLHDLVNKSMDITQAEGLGDTVKAFLGPLKDPMSTAKNALSAGGLITFFVPMSFISPAAASAAGAVGGYRALTLTSDVVADMVAKKTSKWANVLLDGAQGSTKHGYGTWKNIVSALNLGSVDSKTMTKEQAEQEFERAQRIARGEYY